MLPRDLRDSIGDLVKRTVPLELGLQAPGTGTTGRISGHSPGQAGGDFSVFASPGDDERDAVGERFPAGTLAAV